MASRFDIPTVYATLVTKVKEIIDDLKTQGISEKIEYMAWDARQDTNTELPNVDLIGLADWTFDEADHMPEIECVILLSVVNDANLFREVEIANVIRNKCVHPIRPEYLTWTVRDSENNPFSQLTVTNFTMLPSGESEARTVRQFGISLKRADYGK
jgi:hypothetical protein